MKKQKTKFLCQQCGYESVKWLGKCSSCGAWNSFVEEKFSVQTKTYSTARQLTGFSSEVLKLNDISVKDFSRYQTKIREFDNMIGGGVVPGSLILLGGAPGIGKSTLMLHISDALSDQGIVLYISGEESLSQVKSRAERLKVKKDNIFLASETNLQNIVDAINKIEPRFLVIDSIQTTYHPELTGAPGTVGQVRETAAELLRIAKSKNITVFLLGHVTKEGDLAGPRVLEHIVDTVLYFENERQHTYRILRSYKNRFGPTSEIGIFEMNSTGLREVSNPSLIFLGERVMNAAGNIVTVAMEGTRPILLEVQALVARTAFGLPRRMVSGYDANRIIILIAVLEKRLDLPLATQDIFVNIAGGVKVKETSVDLAAACAIVSANSNFVCPKDVIVFGEVGLAGEIRSVALVSERLAEAEKLGFKKAIIPKGNLKNLSYKGKIETFGTETLDRAIKILRN
ncbi:MAG: DNA repair protein RadA [Endomicrobium sp.]|uniref:DNA repair protein RadA n=1 Tax=Candidatus Endomicrobiellum pyrsonymphae TaxID=1408203 RepID=UPI00358C436E|nr:DNA repair protein RadA [Endomicrobium sp.]